MYAVSEGMGFRHLQIKEQHAYKTMLQAFSALDNAVNKAISHISTNSQDEYTKMRKLYEYLQENTKYDTQELQAMAKGRSAKAKLPDDTGERLAQAYMDAVAKAGVHI